MFQFKFVVLNDLYFMKFTIVSTLIRFLKKSMLNLVN
jgi:hypothetical protein